MKTIHLTILLVLIFCAGSTFSPALAADLTPEEEWIPEDPFGMALYTYVDKADFKDDAYGGSVRMHEVSVLAPVPVYRDDTMFASIGAGVTWNHFAFDFNNAGNDTEDLYTIAVPIDLVIMPDDDWTVWANLYPGLLSDLEKVGNDDFVMQGAGAVFYKWSEALQLGLGAAYDREFGDDRFYPLGGAIIHIGRKWKLNLLLPEPSVVYAVNPDLIAFLDARPSGGKWNIHESGYEEDFDFKLETLRVGAGMEYRLSRHLWMHVAAGADIERKYEIRSDNEKLLDSDAEDAFFVRTGIVAR